MTAMIKNSKGKWEDRTIEVLHAAVVECCGPNGWDLYNQSDAISQQLKALSECGEACDSVNKGDYEQLKDDIGDILVCLINWCQIGKLDFIDLLETSKCLVLQHRYIPIKEVCVGLCYALSRGWFTDSMAAIISICKKAEIDPVECLGIAYDVISKRTGRIINGTFVKSEDL